MPNYINSICSMLSHDFRLCELFSGERNNFWNLTNVQPVGEMFSTKVN